MKSVIVILDSFKGNISSIEACRLVCEGLKEAGVKNEIKEFPVADGGEGTVDAFLSAAGGEKVFLKVHDPLMREIGSFYGILPDGTAVIEVAAACGLPLLEGELDIRRASSYGVGELILDAAQKGAENIIVGLGGSAVNDGGVGMASALGIKLFDEDGNELTADHAGLEKVHTVDLSHLSKTLSGVKITAACDVDNPLCGERGASNIFGPQKGASEIDIPYLDGNLARLSKATCRSLGEDFSLVPGSGAAGGLGFALLAFLKAQLIPGIDIVLEKSGAAKEIQKSCLVITGEGKIDGQSAGGKVPVGVSKRAKEFSVPVVAIVGDIASDAIKTYEQGISAIFPINRVALDYEKIRLRSKEDLKATALDLGRLLLATGYLDV